MDGRQGWRAKVGGWNTCMTFLQSKKVKGEKRHGCRFSPAQGIEAE
jgi:hypothetical protein